MNILYILNDYSPMNGCVYVRNVLPARELEKLGHQIKMILFGKDVPKDL